VIPPNWGRLDLFAFRPLSGKQKNIKLSDLGVFAVKYELKGGSHEDKAH
jgi:hypothetical protein